MSLTALEPPQGSYGKEGRLANTNIGLPVWTLELPWWLVLAMTDPQHNQCLGVYKGNCYDSLYWFAGV